MSFRKEKKYKLTKSEYFNLYKELLSQGMSTLHNERQINSCYFDNKSFDMFHQSEEGVLPRKKIRVRWYENKPIYKKEIKTSSIEGRFKTVSETKIKSKSDLLESVFYDSNYGNVYPVSIVSYKRGYYSLNNMRITFDSNIFYYDVSGNLSFRKIDPEFVVEVKVPLSLDDDFIESFLPIPTSRFSKYARSVLARRSLFR